MYGPATSSSPPRLLGRSPQIAAIRRAIPRLARLNTSMLIIGEGEMETRLVARAIHGARPGPARAFYENDICAFPEVMLEAEIFGFERGAFSGARVAQAGWLEQARGGTLCLRNFEHWPCSLQPKLLRVLREGVTVRMGGDRPISVAVRVVAIASMEGFIASGPDSAELYGAVSANRISIPPLRERRTDIPVLVRHYLRHFGKQYDLPGVRLSPEAMSRVMGHEFPGNERELSNSVERAVLLYEGPRIEPDDIMPRQAVQSTVPLGVQLREITRRLRARRAGRTSRRRR